MHNIITFHIGTNGELYYFMLNHIVRPVMSTYCSLSGA